MVTGLLALAAALQQQPQQAAPAPALAASPIARIELATGPEVALTAGDSMKIQARALDASGQPVPNATLRYFPAGGRFEGGVDSTGMIGGQVADLELAKSRKDLADGRRPKRLDDVQHDGLAP